MPSSAILGLLVFFCEGAVVGVGENDERDQPVSTGTDGILAGGVWLRLGVCVLATGTTRGRTGRGYGIFVVFRKGHSTSYLLAFLLRVVDSNAQDSSAAYCY